MDRTFLTVPPQFAQLYTDHGLSHGRYIVGAYGMLPNKRLDTYNEFLTQITNLTNHVNPQSVMIDFEKSMMGALDQVYSIVPQKGCLFHLSKNVYKRVQDEDMSQLYINDEEFRTKIRMISALSFVTIAHKIQAFGVPSNHVGSQEQVILDYFEINYIGELRRGRRLAPRFPHMVWNMSLRVHNELPKTNNNLEGCHNRFADSFQQIYAHIWKFIERLQNDSTLNQHSMVQKVSGAAVPPQRRVYYAINECIQLLVNNYAINNNIDFL